ncbi:MAG: FHA domain-containing protein [Deltaproteobacteria bacterium]|nr:FHA domain-containing protein [Deltaproteobacteria bacterium]
MPTVFKLIIEDDEGKTTVYPLAESELLIGRKDGNTIRLMERNVSRRHARVIRRNGAVFIEDLDSYNGVRINGERINGRYEVKEGDLVEIGDFHLALQAADVEEADDTEAGLAPTHKPTAMTPRVGVGGPRDSSWPTAGTVPDFRLPADVGRGAYSRGEAAGVSGGPRPFEASEDVRGDPGDRADRADRADDHRSTLVDHPLDDPAAKGGPSARTNPNASANDRGAGTPALPPFPRPSGSILTGGDEAIPASSDGARSSALTPQEKHISLFHSANGDSRGGDSARHHNLPDPDPEDDLRSTDQGMRSPRPVAPSTDGADAAAPRPKSLARVAAEPRLICVSTSYAGDAFPLRKSETVIGRVDDNDIVIEHRSVSRSHAKILFDGTTHKVIDLQSANGILVNGEEYAMTDLRPRDLIELGHVRFRFLPAGEVFSPTAEERAELEAAGVEIVGGAAPGASQPKPPSSGALAAPSVPASRSSGSGLSDDVVGAPYDPSMAATVTDTPLSALGHDVVPQPILETRPSGAAQRSLPQASQASQASGSQASPASSPAVRSGPGASADSTSGEDPTNGARGAMSFGTESHPRNQGLGVGLDSDGGVTDRAAAPSGLDEGPTASAKPRHPAAGTRPESYAAAPAALPIRSQVPPPRSSPRRPKQTAKFPIYVLVVVGILLLGVVFLVMTFAPNTDARLEARIQALYEARKFDELLKLCAERKDRLSIEAAHLCGRVDALVNPPQLNQADAPPAGRSLGMRRAGSSVDGTSLGAGAAGGAKAAGAVAEFEDSEVDQVTEEDREDTEAEGGHALGGSFAAARDARRPDLEHLVDGADATASEAVPEASIREEGARAGRNARRLSAAERRSAQRRLQLRQERQERAQRAQDEARAQRERTAADSKAQRETASEMYEQGMKRFLSGDALKAERQFLQCVDLVPDFGDCHRGLGAVYRQRGQKARAVEAFKRYLTIAPRASDAQQVRDAIRALEQD